MTMTEKQSPQRRDPASLAPSVERRWADDFILEQRLLDVPGDRIGDALVTVEAHVLESGESAQEAFGDPRDYARELAESMPSAAKAPGVNPRTSVGAFAGLVGLLLINTAFGSWLDGAPVSLTWGHALAFLLTLVILGAVIAWSSSVLRVLTKTVWVGVLATAVLIAVMVGLMVRMPGVALEGPPLVFGAVGVLLLAVSGVLAWRDHSEDTVLAPGETAPSGNGTRLLTVLAMPVATVIVLAFTWVMHLLG